ncbi:hypothetical protein [Actinopolymorpha alba]|uniref:hypothetical protein n=1 Tax=Actinopolymorpha alba TaxID=533267 RepID=UPI00058C9368|nr:hypothetical protein [Actinopolymorpha alba]
MPVEKPHVYEIRIHGCASSEEALALQEPIARVLCPDKEHDSPCDVPWSFTLGDHQAGDSETGGDTAVLVLCVYTSNGKAVEVADRVRAAVSETHPVTLSEGDAERFEVLVEQYRIERESRRT